VLLLVLDQIILKDLLIFLQNRSIGRETPLETGGTSTRKLADFSAQTYGVRAGGAITKKINYFILSITKRQDNSTQILLISRLFR
jgi:hypothetical protein